MRILAISGSLRHKSYNSAVDGAQWAQAGLVEILNVMSANRVIPGAVLKLDAIRKRLNEQGEIVDASTCDSIKRCIQALANSVIQP